MYRSFLSSVFMVVIYTLSTCPYCLKAKNLLDSKNVKYQEIIVDNYTKEQRDELIKKHGMRTFPQIFINDELIGGCKELHDLEQSGKLDKMLI
ncbi:Glutaredoxin [Rickettsiales endosymbiont of Paramecium tredecaurelia]|uniref:glutaredoxin 3 n=1 Tax=Candidatus Sarmatiella mevalonica TaxID=2770581 RepID=UPI00192187FF|nr:glutaredoxin 3 [Candidatus Sarmatiella mevalonica]MBL3284440.1 Glutaredoxin [Candidatus Sarmatiella mevalonica]